MAVVSKKKTPIATRQATPINSTYANRPPRAVTPTGGVVSTVHSSAAGTPRKTKAAKRGGGR